MTSLVRRALYFPCMKNKITSEALIVAITKAITIFHLPKSLVAAKTVSNVKTIREKKITT
jgi:hypothetical protein